MEVKLKRVSMETLMDKKNLYEIFVQAVEMASKDGDAAEVAKLKPASKTLSGGPGDHFKLLRFLQPHSLIMNQNPDPFALPFVNKVILPVCSQFAM
jgi:hypothetical protein